jgi:hypothetical protein
MTNIGEALVDSTPTTPRKALPLPAVVGFVIYAELVVDLLYLHQIHPFTLKRPDQLD